MSKEQMTHPERFRAVMNFQPVDRLPCHEWAVWWDKTVARWAGEGRDFTMAMNKIARLFQELKLSDKSAKFVCSLALCDPQGNVEVFEGDVHGHLEFPPRGKNGFGYDPIFVANGMKQTFGEIDPAEKHAISHRGRAFDQVPRGLAEQRGW